MSGLFSTLDTSRMGLTAHQAALDVTSHNIANANTEGYTKQRVDMQSIYDDEVPKTQSEGRGVQVSDIERIKDVFLDYQIRNQTSDAGTNKAISNYLGQLQNIMNEPSGTGIASLFSTFFTNWHNLNQSAQTETTRGLITTQTKTLTDQLNSMYKKLQDLKENCNKEIDNEVVNINSTLDKINSLNNQIINVKASGGEPNDLMDSRDLLLKNLSAYFNVNVDNKGLGGIEVTASNSNQFSGTNLVQVENPDKEVRFSYVSNIEPDPSVSGVYKLTYYKFGDKTSERNRVDVYVSGISSDQLDDIKRNRVLWADNDGNAIGLSVDKNGKKLTNGADSAHPVTYNSTSMFTPTDGTLKGTSSVQTDVDKYIDYLNKIAKALAFSVNEVESGSITTDNDKLPFFVNGDVANSKYTLDSNGKNILTGSNLDSVLNAESSITAGNISINKEIYDHPMEIKTRVDDTGDASESSNTTNGPTDGKRAQAVADLANKLLNIQGITASTTREGFFATQDTETDSNGIKTVKNYNGGNTIADYLTDVVTQLGTEVSAANTTLKNSKLQLQNLQQSRDSLSGVSLDEEMTSLIQYNHAYQANAKVIATVDQLLDVVINGLKK